MAKVFLYVTVLIIISSSCSETKKLQEAEYLLESNCNRERFDYTAEDLPDPYLEKQFSDELNEHFSERSLNIANAIEVLELLDDYAAAREVYSRDSSLSNKVDLMYIDQQIRDRVNYSSLQISAVASEIDCEEERSEQIANFLYDREQRVETRLTVAAIIVGAAAAIAAGIVIVNSPETNAGEFIGVGSGITEAALGIGILKNKRKIELHHEHNILHDVWHNTPISTSFPPSIWYYLNYNHPDSEFDVTLRDRVVDRWETFGELPDEADVKEREKIVQLFFGNGGKYTSEMLFTRSAMLDQLEAQIKLMKQDLQTFVREMEALSLY